MVGDLQARLSDGDRRRLDEVIRDVEGWNGPLDLARLMTPLREIIDLDIPIAYGLAYENQALRLSHLESTDTLRPVRDRMDRDVQSTGPRYFGYNPLIPDIGERNRSVCVTPSEVQRKPIGKLVARVGLADHFHLRALVCDGPVLLTWLGGLVPEAPSQRQHALLDRLVPTVRKRMRLDRRLRCDGQTRAALDACWEQLGVAGFVVNRRGAIEHGNAAGWSRLEREGRDLLERLHAALQGSGEFEVHSLASAGQSGYLLIERPTADSQRRVRRAAQRWSLSARQAEVAQLLVQGHSNERIAVELGVAIGTVEIHVSNILLKADCESRSQLVASIWAA